MWNRSFLRSTTLRTASALSSMLVSAAVLAGAAHAQSLPTLDALPSGGVDLTTGPNGLQVGVDAGDTGGVTVGAGQGGVNLDLRTTPKSQCAARPAGARWSRLDSRPADGQSQLGVIPRRSHARCLPAG